MPEGTPYVSANYPNSNLRKNSIQMMGNTPNDIQHVKQERNTLKIRKKTSGKKRITRVEKKEIARPLSDRATL